MMNRELFHYSVIVWVVLFLAIRHRGGLVACKEIEATDEWQLIGENDTLPAGLYIRMDLATGQKWVKLPDKKNNNDEGNNINSDKSTVNIQADGSVVSASSSIQSVAALVPLEQKAGDDNRDAVEQDDFDPLFDFEMMHRTLAQLPPEEHERIGGLPELPGGSLASLSPKKRELFELRMRQIWDQRQEELRRIQEEQLADIPKILKQRIQTILEYLRDPETHLLSMNDKSLSQDEQALGSIVSVLADLEYLLTDLDMARDFYTLGGWPLLVSLVSQEVHYKNGTVNDEHYLSLVHQVQSNAAWALGTAVKNTGEFNPWAVEGIVIGSVHTTALDLVLQTFQTTLSATLDSQPMVPQLQQKLIYALGSFLRGNWHAQIRFEQIHGPAVLAQVLKHFSDRNNNNNNNCLDHCQKMSQRILSIASDLLMDVRTSQQQQWKNEKTPHADALLEALDHVVEAFSGMEWCTTILGALQDPKSSVSFQRAALHSIPPFSFHCRWDVSTQLKPILTKLVDLWHDEHGETTFQDEFDLVNQIVGNNLSDI